MKKANIKYLTELYPNNELENKTILITGGNSGIGYQVAKDCLFLKMNVIIACRNDTKMMETIKQLKKQFPKANIDGLKLDLTSFASVKLFSNKIINNKIDIEYFYHNAGIFNSSRELTVDGYDQILQTNFLSVYLINNLLEDYFKSLNHQVRVIFTTSIAANQGDICYSDLNLSQNYGSYKMYKQSKLLVAQYARFLSSNYKDTNISIVAVHPGAVYTNLFNDSYNKVVRSIGRTFMPIIFNPVWKGGLPTIYALNKDIKSGAMIGPRGLMHLKGYPKITDLKRNKYVNIYDTMNTINNLMEKEIQLWKNN